MWEREREVRASVWEREREVRASVWEGREDSSGGGGTSAINH